MKTGYIYSALVLVFFALSTAHAGPLGVKRKKPRLHEYGNVLIDNYSPMKNSVSPVVFKHWLHRSKYTCRLCHVDIGFAMLREQSDITCEDIKNGLYCGACHDGGEAFARIGMGAGGEDAYNCELCHSHDQNVNFKYEFYGFRRKLPRERFGNGIDWVKAEEDGVIVLVDFLENVSLSRKKLNDPRELQVSSKEAVMPDIIFSHEKHAVWSGCELCHPELFGIKTGGTVYGMEEIFDGKYCGACHGHVAFPNRDCQRCHATEVH